MSALSELKKRREELVKAIEEIDHMIYELSPYVCTLCGQDIPKGEEIVIGNDTMAFHKKCKETFDREIGGKKK